MASINLRQRRVLIADNDYDTVERLTFALDECGAIVAGVTTSHAALEVLNSWVPDIIISDFAMPDDGRHIAARAGELGIPAIALTEPPLPEAARRIIASGFETYVTKPFDPQELCQIIA